MSDMSDDESDEELDNSSRQFNPESSFGILTKSICFDMFQVGKATILTRPWSLLEQRLPLMS